MTVLPNWVVMKIVDFTPLIVNFLISLFGIVKGELGEILGDVVNEWS